MEDRIPLTTEFVLSASLEDYLEAIFLIVADKQAAKVGDISKKLKVAKPSVTGALQSLRERGLINYRPYDVVTLTPEGTAIAERVVRRHEVLRSFLEKVLNVPLDKAEDAACKMEHAVRGEIIDRFVQFLEFVEACPRGGEKWIKGFSHYCEHGRDYKYCERCLSLCLEEVKQKAAQKEEGMAETMKLNEVGPGRKARITKVQGKGEVKRRIIDMGVTPGTFVEVERVAPLGDPIEIRVKGYHLSLRKEEAARIFVELE